MGVKGDERDPDTWVIREMVIEGAKMESESLEISQDRRQNQLEKVYFKWIKTTDKEGLTLPIYLNNTRKKLIISVVVNGGNVQGHIWHQLGTAFISWNI